MRRRLANVLGALEGSGATRAEIDRILREMREELIEARAELRAREEEVSDYEARLAALRGRDVDRTALAEVEAEVYRRRAEVGERRREVAALTDRFREAVRGRDVLPVRERRARASEEMRGAGVEEAEELDRLEERIEDADRQVEAEREVREALGESPEAAGSASGAERQLREAEADRLLRELKREMGSGDEDASGSGSGPGRGDGGNRGRR